MERIVVETERYSIVGDLTLPREGYRSRLSDFLNRGDVDFVALVNVDRSELDGNGAAPERHPFLAVARSHIRVVHPLERD